MPVYDYACSACGHRVEVLHGRDDAGPAVCEVCGGPMRKLLSAPTIHFRGSGWAKRDRAVATAPGGTKRGDETSAAGGSGDGGGTSSDAPGGSDGKQAPAAAADAGQARPSASDGKGAAGHKPRSHERRPTKPSAAAGADSD